MCFPLYYNARFPSMVKGAGLKIRCVVLRGFKSHSRNHSQNRRNENEYIRSRQMPNKSSTTDDRQARNQDGDREFADDFCMSHSEEFQLAISIVLPLSPMYHMGEGEQAEYGMASYSHIRSMSGVHHSIWQDSSG